MESYKKLLDSNKTWAQNEIRIAPDFFERTACEQTPEFLWIGCSDSRVPAEEIVGSAPGEIFVHRNVANLVVHTDFNLLSVVQYGVEVLKIKHIIVCGHYGCGGVQAAMSPKYLGLINKWLRHIQDVYHDHTAELDAIADDNKRFRRLVELNVVEQASHIAQTSFVQHAWQRENRPLVHGWVYDVSSGLIKDLLTISPDKFDLGIYRYEFSDL